MKSLERKLLYYIPVSIFLIVIIHLYVIEVAGILIFIMAVGSFVFTRSEWKYVKEGVESIEILDGDLFVKKFPMNAKPKKLSFSELNAIMIKDDSIIFSLKSTSFWLREETLIDGDWNSFKEQFTYLAKEYNSSEVVLF